MGLVYDRLLTIWRGRLVKGVFTWKGALQCFKLLLFQFFCFLEGPTCFHIFVFQSNTQEVLFLNCIDRCNMAQTPETSDKRSFIMLHGNDQSIQGLNVARNDCPPLFRKIQGPISPKVNKNWFQASYVPVHITMPWHVVENCSSILQGLLRHGCAFAKWLHQRHHLQGLDSKSCRISSGRAKVVEDMRSTEQLHSTVQHHETVPGVKGCRGLKLERVSSCQDLHPSITPVG